MNTESSESSSRIGRVRSAWRRVRGPLAVLAVVSLLGATVLVLAFHLGDALLTFLGTALVGADPDAIGRFVARAAAIGFVVMALIQLARNLFGLRGRFHRRAVDRWLLRGIERFSKERRDRIREHPDWTKLTSEAPHQQHPLWEVFRAGAGSSDTACESEEADRPKTLAKIGAEATGRLVRLAVTHDDRLLFDLPIERLCGQLSAAADQVLDDPRGSEVVLLGLAGEAGCDVAWRYPALWRAVEERPAKEPSSSKQAGDLPTREKERPDEEAGFLAARGALTHHIQRNVDGLQISAGMTWRRRLWWTAVGLAFLVAAALALAQRGEAAASLLTLSGWRAFGAGLAGSVVTALVAGFLATVFRDLLAVVERHRR